MTTKEWQEKASVELKNAGIRSHRLDAELIITHVLRISRTKLHAYPDIVLNSLERKVADDCVYLRSKRVPLAYIFGHKEFYGRKFHVSKATLIPRPESETLIEELKRLHSIYGDTTSNIIDVGTGSGILAITSKLEMPSVKVIATDISNEALEIARKNAAVHNADLKFIKSDLLDNVKDLPSTIVANLPYVDRSWETSPETAYEPAEALFAKDGGLVLIKKLISQAAERDWHGLMLLEADPEQHLKIDKYAKKYGFSKLKTNGYILILKR